MSLPRSAAEAALREHRLVAILRDVPAGHLPALGRALFEGGVRLLEVTLSHAGGLEGVSLLREALPSDALVGAGTVVSRADAAAALEAGAQFLVAPNLEPEVVELARSRDMALVPGVMTPSEVARAQALGCSILKLFPAAPLGPSFVRALRGPFPDLELLVVGGIGPENLGEYLRAGALGAGVGGRLTEQDWANPDFSKTRETAAALCGCLPRPRDAKG